MILQENDKFYEVDIDTNGTLSNNVLQYIVELSKSRKFTLRDLTKKGDIEYKAKYYLSYGITRFKYKDTHMEVHYNRYENSVVGTAHYPEFPTTLKIICYSEKEILTKFLIDAKEFSQPQKEDKIICRILKNGFWSFLNKLPKRNQHSVFLPEGQKENILNDVEKFKNRKELYFKYGVPFKRNFLLEGQPGCGKTTLILTVASELNMDIAIVSFAPAITDGIFMNAVSNLPKNSILVLEDIDSLFIKRESSRENKSCVSFSGVLNILDGLARREGLITFMTTNFAEKLDRALVRPGRIDYKLHFDYATKYQIKEMYKFFFPNKMDSFDKFYKQINKYKTNTCILQKYFFENLEENDICDNLKDFIKMCNDFNGNQSYKSMYA